MAVHGPSRRTQLGKRTRVAVCLALAASLTAVGALRSGSEQTVVEAAGGVDSGGEYHAIEPDRVLDTRLGLGASKIGTVSVPTGQGATFEVQVVGPGGLPALADLDSDEVLAVAVSATVVAPSAPGYLRMFGSGATEGGSSQVNFQARQTVPNLAIVRPGDNGKIVVRLVSETVNGNAHVLIDVFGWFSTSSFGDQGARTIPVGPGRIFDSRTTTPFNAGEVRTVDIRGADSTSPARTDIVPNSSSVIGALVNITAVNNLSTSSDTFVSATPTAPAAGTLPSTSNLNLRNGDIKANLALVPVGPDGKIRLFNERGNVHLLVDVVAYLRTGMDPSTNQGRVVPLVSPNRVIDTRSGSTAGKLGPGQGEDWDFSEFVDSVEIGGTWVGPQSALIGNLTGTGLVRQYPTVSVETYMTAYPSAVSNPKPPDASNINLVENESVPNMALLTYGSAEDASGNMSNSMVRFYNYSGSIDYIFDVSAVILAG